MYSELSHTQLKPVQSEGMFTFSQVVDFSVMSNRSGTKTTAAAQRRSHTTVKTWDVKKKQ